MPTATQFSSFPILFSLYIIGSTPPFILNSKILITMAFRFKTMFTV